MKKGSNQAQACVFKDQTTHEKKNPNIRSHIEKNERKEKFVRISYT